MKMNKKMTYQEKVNDQMESAIAEARIRINTHNELIDLGNENPTEEQIEKWSSYINSKKQKPKTAEEARINLKKKQIILIHSGLESRATKLGEKVMTGCFKTNVSNYHKEACENLLDLASLYDSFMSEDLIRKTNLIAYFAHKDKEFRKAIGKQSFERVIKKWDKTHFNGGPRYYGNEANSFGITQKITVENAAKIISSAIHLGIYSPEYNIYEKNTKESYKESYGFARMLKKGKGDTSKFYKTKRKHE